MNRTVILTIQKDNVHYFGEIFLARATWYRSKSENPELDPKYQESKNILNDFCENIRKIGFNPIKMFEEINEYMGQPIELSNMEGLEELPSEMGSEDFFIFEVYPDVIDDGVTCANVINEKKREHHGFALNFDVIISIDDRKKNGIPHDSRTEDLFNFIQEYDYFFGKNLLHSKTEEELEYMKYLIDEYFANKDK